MSRKATIAALYVFVALLWAPAQALAEDPSFQYIRRAPLEADAVISPAVSVDGLSTVPSTAVFLSSSASSSVSVSEDKSSSHSHGDGSSHTHGSSSSGALQGSKAMYGLAVFAAGMGLGMIWMQ